MGIGPVLYRRATMAVQGFLSATEPALVVDGKFGKFTTSVYERATAADKSAIDAMLRGLGTTVSGLRAERASVAAVRDQLDQKEENWIPVEDAAALVRRHAARYGIGTHAEALVDFLRREARMRVVQGVPFYDVKSKNGSSRGLMQMQPAAWEHVQQAVDRNLPPYESAVWDPETNIRAGVAYAIINIRAIQAAGKPVNADTLYLAHNQGAGFFTKGTKTNVAGQSKEVQALIARYSKS